MRAAIALSSLALLGVLAGAEPAGAQAARPAKPAQPAQPAKPDQQAKPEKPCRQQIEDLCSNTVPNTPERRACVKQSIEKLSPGCQRQLGHARMESKPPGAAAGGLQGLVEACSKDHARMVELCQQGQAGGASTVPCLKQHKSEFSEPCQKMIDQADEAERAKQAGAKPAGAAH